MATTKNWIFNVYFHYKGAKGKEKAETRRYETLVYLKKLLESRARFSVIAKDENKPNSCLLLRGYMNLNDTCTNGYAKKLLGKCSNCKPSIFGDVVNLMKLFHIDEQVTVTGRLPAQGNNGSKTMKSYATDAKWIINTLVEQIDKQDFDDCVKVKVEGQE